MLIGLIKPVIALPMRVLSEEELEMTLSHELAHLRRGDLVIKLAMMVLNAVHWFNPLVYLIKQDSAALCEGACDEAVAASLNPKQRIIYGETILSALEHGAAWNAELCTGMCSAGKNIQRRLSNMMYYKKAKPLRTALAITLSALLTLGGTVIAVAAADFAPGYVYEAPDYNLVFDRNQSGDIPEDMVSVEEAADVAVKAITEYFGVDLNGKTVYAQAYDLTGGYYILTTNDENEAPESPPGEERIPVLQHKWLFYTEYGPLCQYEADVSGDGTLASVRRVFRTDGSIGRDSGNSQTDRDFRSIVMTAMSNGKISYVTRMPAAHYKDKGYSLIEPLDNSNTDVKMHSQYQLEKLLRDVNYDAKTLEMLNALKTSPNEYTLLAVKTAERFQATPDVATAECIGVSRYRQNGVVYDYSVIDVRVTALDGTRAVFSFRSDTKEFLGGRFEPDIALDDMRSNAMQRYLGGI
jgi:hypothetical protein